MFITQIVAHTQTTWNMEVECSVWAIKLYDRLFIFVFIFILLLFFPQFLLSNALNTISIYFIGNAGVGASNFLSFNNIHREFMHKNQVGACFFFLGKSTGMTMTF